MESYNLVIEKPKEITFFEGYGYSYVMNNPLKFTDPSGYLSAYGNYMWKQATLYGGSFYYRGEFYNWNKKSQGFDIYGGFDGTTPHGFMGGATVHDPYTGTTFVNGEQASVFEYIDETTIQLPDHVVERITQEIAYRQQLMASFNGQSNSVGRESGQELGQFVGFDSHFFGYNESTGKYYIPWTDVEINPIDVLCGKIDWYGMLDASLEVTWNSMSHESSVINDAPIPHGNSIEPWLIPGFPIVKAIKRARAVKAVVKFPGYNPAQAPKGFKWRGKPGSKPGSRDGNWYNYKTGESLHPDLSHPNPIGPHWDYRDPNGNWWRILPDGNRIPK